MSLLHLKYKPRFITLNAPRSIDGAVDAEIFDLYIKSQLVRTLREGDTVSLDNLSSHKSPRAARALRKVGAWFLFPPPYSPGLNPIEMAFLKLKTLIRKAAARPYLEFWLAVGHVCDLLTEKNAATTLELPDTKPMKRNTLKTIFARFREFFRPSETQILGDPFE